MQITTKNGRSLVLLADTKRHLICYPYSVPGLHDMAETIGLKRHWFHKGRFPHYDLPKRRLEGFQPYIISVRDILNIIKGAQLNAEMVHDGLLAKDIRTRCPYLNKHGHRCTLVLDHGMKGIALHEYGYQNHGDRPCCERNRIIGATVVEGTNGWGRRQVGGYEVRFLHSFSGTAQWGRYHSWRFEWTHRTTGKGGHVFANSRAHAFQFLRERLAQLESMSDETRPQTEWYIR